MAQVLKTCGRKPSQVRILYSPHMSENTNNPEPPLDQLQLLRREYAKRFVDEIILVHTMNGSLSTVEGVLDLLDKFRDDNPGWGDDFNIKMSERNLNKRYSTLLVASAKDYEDEDSEYLEQLLFALQLLRAVIHYINDAPED
jgi:hypothetical protein